jgi:hypothetical protein
MITWSVGTVIVWEAAIALDRTAAMLKAVNEAPVSSRVTLVLNDDIASPPLSDVRR